jgi:hypothetical protein
MSQSNLHNYVVFLLLNFPPLWNKFSLHKILIKLLKLQNAIQMYVNSNNNKSISIKWKIIIIQISKVKIKRLDNTVPTIEIGWSGAVYSKAYQTKGWDIRKVPLQQQHPGTLKKPQGPATFWGDATEIFPSVILHCGALYSKVAIQKVDGLGGCHCTSHILGHRKTTGCWNFLRRCHCNLYTVQFLLHVLYMFVQ